MFCISDIIKEDDISCLDDETFALRGEHHVTSRSGPKRRQRTATVTDAGVILITD